VGCPSRLRLLLDTHIWVWTLIDRARLSGEVTREIEAAENEIWLSPISLWEVLVLVEKRRIRLNGRDPVRWISDGLQALPLREAPLTNEVAIQSRIVRLPHDDPADRFLAATARLYGLTLVTADERLLGSRDFRALANR
jgi:PIN domain nuclease of toxin-antitoxin system